MSAGAFIRLISSKPDMDPLCSARRLLLGCLLPGLINGGMAQVKPAAQAAPQDQVSASAPIQSATVSLPVVVRDKKGALIQNLTKGDFTLQVDGKPQVLRSCNKDTGRPLSLGIIIDTGPSQHNTMDEERNASSTFLDQMLTTPHDKAFVIQFSRQTELLQDLTSSRPSLGAALKEVGTPTVGEDSTIDASSRGSSGSTGGSSRNPHSASGNSTASTHRTPSTLYDALFLASDEIMRKQTARRVIVLLSDGVDSGSKETLDHAIEAAQRADTIVYGIYFRGEAFHQAGNNPASDNNGYPYPGGGYPGGGYPGGGYPGGGYPGGGYPGGGYPGGYPGDGYPGGTNPTGSTASRRNIDGRKVLERMAQETGGRVFDVKKNQDIAHTYAQIAEELQAQYLLGFIPGDDVTRSGLHQVDLSLRQKGLTVQTRDGFYTPK